MEEANASGMAASDALLLGRVTYEQMAAYWPHQAGGVPMVDYINSVPKFVVSTTLKEPLEWNNSTLIKGNVAEAISELKRHPGKDITTLGSGALVRSLLQEDLLDELRLMVHPIVLGGGKRLFEDADATGSLARVQASPAEAQDQAARRANVLNAGGTSQQVPAWKPADDAVDECVEVGAEARVGSREQTVGAGPRAGDEAENLQQLLEVSAPALRGIGGLYPTHPAQHLPVAYPQDRAAKRSRGLEGAEAVHGNICHSASLLLFHHCCLTL